MTIEGTFFYKMTPCIISYEKYYDHKMSKNRLLNIRVVRYMLGVTPFKQFFIGQVY